jgi:predicted PurR-regulated permease PerM
MSGALGGIVKGLIQIPVTVVSVIFSIVVVAVIAFFWLTGIERLKPFFVSLFPYQIQPDVSDVLAEMGHRVGGYVRGVGINMLVIGMLSGAVDFFLGVPYPVLLGIFAGLTELIPYFGPWIGGAPAVLLGLISGGPILALEVVAGYIIIQEIEGHTLVPFVMMRAVKVNPLTVVIAVLLGTELLGVVGGILAVPAATIIHVLMVRVVGPAARQMAGHVSDSGVMPIESDEPPTNVQKEHGEADQPADKAGMRH